MAYNNYYSAYQPMMGYPYQQQIQPNYNYQQQAYPQAQMQMTAQNQQTQPQIQNGGFIQVHDENEARNYPIAPGNSVTFKDENAPYVYTKTMGFSQLDRPIFEKYRLVKEDDMPTLKKSLRVIHILHRQPMIWTKKLYVTQVTASFPML